MAVDIDDSDGVVWIVTLSRPAVRNAVDGEHARLLADAFRRFDADARAQVAVLTGGGGTFCAGADLKAVGTERGNAVEPLPADGPMGPTRLVLDKPVIAAIEGHAVAGGLELACWCDLRVAADDAVLGVFCRRWGVPLIDGGTIRLPRLIGLSRALDLILTGRAVDAHEAHAMGLVNRVAPSGKALEAALVLARQIAASPALCMRTDRRSALEQGAMSFDAALENELRHGLRALTDMADGVARFNAGAGRHGA